MKAAFLVVVGLLVASTHGFAESLDPFLFTIDGSCTDPSSVMFRPVGFMTMDLGKAANGNKMEGSVSVYMKADRTFSVQYSEREILACESKPGETWCYFHPRMEKWFSGSWKQDTDGAVVFQGLGVAQVITYNQHPALLLKIENGFFAPLAAGKVSTGWKIATNVGENGVSINQYCGINP